MTQRITKDMLQQAVDSYTRTLASNGMLEGPLDFVRGNTSYKYAWTLRYQADGTSPVGIESGILGHTAREAFDRLHTIMTLVHDIKVSNYSL